MNDKQLTPEEIASLIEDAKENLLSICSTEEYGEDSRPESIWEALEQSAALQSTIGELQEYSDEQNELRIALQARVAELEKDNADMKYWLKRMCDAWDADSFMDMEFEEIKQLLLKIDK